MLWKLNSSNSRGQPVNYNLGALANGLQTSFTYDAQGRVSGITTGQMKQTLSFDPASGNLMSRDYRVVNNPSGLTEHFEYDQLNRLIKSVVIGQDSIMTGYSPNGNITSKSDAGSYAYDAAKVNAVTDISGNPGSISLTGQTIEYNSFNLTTNIVEGDSTYSILYNPCNQRIKTVYSSQPGTNVTKYYSGSYEKTVTGGVTKETHYISSPFGLVAVIVKQGENVQTYFAETDHLGSIIGLLNADKSYAEQASFDPWGRRRNPSDWSYQNVPVPQITDRGFTGHEHLDQFGLINMNGRMYDPVLGRFLGVDPLVQSLDFSQSFNGYSYCLNNPLKYIDPTGYVQEKEELTAWDIAYTLWTLGGGFWSSDIGYIPYYLSNLDFSHTWDRTYFRNGTEGVYVRVNTEFGKSSGTYLGDVNILEVFVPLVDFHNFKDVASSDGGNWLNDAWNSTIARLYVPDYVHIGVGFVGIAGCGAGTSFELNWVLRGPQASIKPIITTTVTVGGGYQVDATLNIGGSTYLGPVSEIRRDFLQTSIRNGQAGIFGSGGGSALGKIGLTGTWTPTATGYGLFQTEANIGVGLTPGPNGAGGASNTFILKDFYRIIHL